MLGSAAIGAIARNRRLAGGILQLLPTMRREAAKYF